MKKLICVLSVFTLIFTSCSSDSDSSSDNPEGTLVKKIIETEDGESITSDFLYTGNKLNRINDSDGAHEIITYTGDLITKWEYFDEEGILTMSEIYQYNGNNQLAVYLSINHTLDLDINPNNTSKYTYTHNANGSISYVGTYGPENAPTIASNNGTITATNVVTNYVDGATNVSETTVYDSKNSPFKNVTGYSKVCFASNFASNNANNPTSYQSARIGMDDEVTYITFNLVHTYNSNNFPATSVETDTETNETIAWQYFYQ